ncbi:hypothetical protein TanjilG_19103 [Lupinus angustifolius]|uniref:FRIGIDA-like protein n=1 Tax=Lupinus angustifolius TaxID=3871 RepID=A0A4P1RRX9_LUPAN|nr:PREDICTED: truncated FRIGIDA-like protein 1 [Lupinus angustifolius]OIW16387.1 hypothetical protein TanjilG_19103 [Lupinus angustifolius]
MSNALKTISDSLKLVDTKKENLKKAYDDLQSHSSLFSFPHTWSQIDSHFNSLHNSLTQRFLLLQQNHPSSSNSVSPNQNPKVSNFSSFLNDPTTQNGTTTTNSTHMEQMGALCKVNDGKGLRNYLVVNYKDIASINPQLVAALKCSHDPASLVLDSLDGVIGANGLKDSGEVKRMKKVCGVLFQVLRVVCRNVSDEVRKRANRLFLEWKRSLVKDNADAFGAMAFLHFVATYGLLSELSTDELTTFSAVAATNDELSELYHNIGLTDKVPGLVQKLIDKGKHILAVKYVFQFNLVDKIRPVPILHAYVNETQKRSTRLSQEGKSLAEITTREIHGLKSVIKVIENHNLESEFPRASLEQRIEELKKQKANPPQHEQQQNRVKRPRISAPVGPAAVVNSVGSASSTIHQYGQPIFHSTGLLPEHPNPYLGLPARPYGMVPPTPAISPYPGPSTGPYGPAVVPMGPTGNPGRGYPHLTPSVPNVPPSGFGLQHYYRGSYPR